MLNAIALAALTGGIFMLGVLSACDLKTRLLPNTMVAGFAALGLIFQAATRAQFVSVPHMLAGAATGFALLYIVRAVANRFYGEDALGLGDVKLMAAAGLWLGPDGVLLALAAGAFAALLHGLVYGLIVAYRTGTRPDFARLKIPAGPGFAVGIIFAGAVTFAAFRLTGAT